MVSIPIVTTVKISTLKYLIHDPYMYRIVIPANAGGIIPDQPTGYTMRKSNLS